MEEEELGRENAVIPEMPKSAAERKAQCLEKEVGPEGVGFVVSITTCF